MLTSVLPNYTASFYPHANYYQNPTFIPPHCYTPPKEFSINSHSECCAAFETPIKNRAGSYEDSITPEKQSKPAYWQRPALSNFSPQQALAGGYNLPDGSYHLKSQNVQSGEEQTASYSDLQYKKPKKTFNTREARQEYIKSYLAKEKTELCKNWETYGWCKFGDRCSFAHGVHELRVRTDMAPTFKSKQCKQFSETMFCPYGSRCQFIHCPYTIEDQNNSKYEKMMKDNINFSEQRIKCLGNPQIPAEFDDHLVYVSSYERRRLNVFCQLAEGHKVIPN